MEFLLKLFLRTFDAYYNAEAFHGTLDLLIARGFRLISETEEAEYAHVSPEATPTLRQEIAEYLAHHKDEMYIRACYLGDTSLELQIFPMPEEGVLACVVEQDLFTEARRGENSEFYPLLLEACKDLYRAWHPAYGHSYYEVGMNPSRDEVITQQIEYLYWVNLFGPELVQKLGRERLLGAPAWKVDELEDGAIFLAPTEYLAHPGYSLKEVAGHLGLQTPQLSGEEWDEWR